jgi:polysaccharide deacetylase family protein (PEP-CTERM system associated)
LENALSIDLEDWHHPLLVHRNLACTPKTSRIVESTEPLLSLLKRYGVRATFFCVGEILEQQPGLVQRIHGLGHEIAFHGMRHRPLWNSSPAEFDAELGDFDRLGRQVLGQDLRIRGFRAPTFSLDQRTGWALPILARRGYLYDSSVFPMRGPLYGVPNAPVGPYRISFDDPSAVDPESSLTEVPPAVCRIAGIRIPVGGGVYLRLLPMSLLVRLLGRINEERPFIIYIHPWETDPETPRVRMPAMARFATYPGIQHGLRKVERLLNTFRFTTVAEVVERLSTGPNTATREATC